MSKDRLETFSDWVFGIVLSLLVLELHGPNVSDYFGLGQCAAAMAPLVPTVVSFVLTFVMICTYWVGHHYFFGQMGHVTVGVETASECLSQRKELNMEIKRNGSQPSGKGDAGHFTGAVRIDPLFQAPEPARAVGAAVTFEPRARTAWHSHPLGQTLIVTAGCGRVQSWGGEIVEIRPGDVIWAPPGEKHWHGAASTTAVTHMAIQESLDGKTADWMEKVSDEQYEGASSS